MPIVLITGANRGIGERLVTAYLEKGYEVIAAVRDPATVTAQKGVTVVKLDAGSLTDAKEAASELQSKGIKSIDIIIANAAANVSGDDFLHLDHAEALLTWEVNVRGPIVLFQAFYDLLPRPHGKFVVVSSGKGTISGGHSAVEATYGQSKAAVNYMIANMHYVYKDIAVLALNPGWVPTKMGNRGAQLSGLKEAPDDFNKTIPGMVNVVEELTRDNYGGKLVNWDGKIMNW